MAAFWCFSPRAVVPCGLEVKGKAGHGHIHGGNPLQRARDRAWKGALQVNGLSSSVGELVASIK